MDRKKTEQETGHRHILVGVSASPTNARIIHTAAQMADAFGGAFTALYVQTSDADKMSEADKKRLQENIRFAEQSGATMATVYGDDISYQIAEFAHLSGAGILVIGRSNVTRRHFWNKPTLAEKLAAIAPNLEIHIIPDPAERNQYPEKKEIFSQYILPSCRDLLIMLLILAVTTGIGNVFWIFGFTEANIITVYILGVLLTALFTKSHACSVIASLASVLVFNFFFTEPRLTLHAYEPGYPVTFAIMLFASLITGSLANRLKNHAKQSAQAAFRTQVLFDTNQLLQKAQDDDAMIQITASQLMKLLERDVIAYPEQKGKLGKGYLFNTVQGISDESFFTQREKMTAEWVLQNKKHAGATTDTWKDAKCLYLAIRINQKVYGVVGIHIAGRPLDSFEKSVLLSILGECALAIENNHNAKEKEQAAVLAKNEQLRANLLRAISHDLRTPLTSISGNAGYLVSSYDKLDDEMRMQVFTDIQEDALWLIRLMENLLSLTRIEDGSVELHTSSELVQEVIEEALKHIDRKSSEYHIQVKLKDELLFARMDARLIVQVIINLVDNAIKYTPSGSSIVITAQKKEEMVSVSIADDGPGIPDSEKDHVFEMFFTGEKQIADGRRSLGLGLALCRSIINAHGGEIVLTDNKPHGCVFTFTLPWEEVNLHV